MIAIDWGTSSFRAFRLDAGQIIDRIPAGPGILAIAPTAFAETLRTAIAPWLQAGERTILMAGMVGSRQGWVEAPYLACPANPQSLAAAAIRIPFDGADLRLIPGLSLTAGDTPEVMRGEEVQVAGVLDRTGPDALICLPGTHAKWVTLRAGQITGFTTHMTGEAFAALRHHTILGRLMHDTPTDPAFQQAAFQQGVDRAGRAGGLLHHLFGVRTLGLFDRLAPEHAASYLSGLLIGHEIHAMAPREPVNLVGAPALCALYALAITMAGGKPVILDEDAAASGLALLAQHIDWTTP